MADTAEPCALHELRWCGLCSPQGSALPPGGIVYGPDGQFTVAPPVPSVVFSPPQWDTMAATAATAADTGLGSWRPAKYDGHCRACGQAIAEGDMIRWCDDEEGWVCETCGTE